MEGDCAIRVRHHPVPHQIQSHYLIPRGWQRQLYDDEVRIQDQVSLCPTHHVHAHLALNATVGQMCFQIDSIYDRRQFGREIWAWSEDAALWLRERLPQKVDLDWQV